MNFDFRPYTDNIYQCCFVRLKASDIDQEVKERAISVGLANDSTIYKSKLVQDLHI